MRLFCLNSCTVKLKTAALSLSSTFKTAVASAVISFNDGAKGLLPVFDQLGIEPGHYTMKGFTRVDLERIKQSDRKSTDGVKVRPKTLRAIRKDFFIVHASL